MTLSDFKALSIGDTVRNTTGAELPVTNIFSRPTFDESGNRILDSFIACITVITPSDGPLTLTEDFAQYIS